MLRIFCQPLHDPTLGSYEKDADIKCFSPGPENSDWLALTFRSVVSTPSHRREIYADTKNLRDVALRQSELWDAVKETSPSLPTKGAISKTSSIHKMETDSCPERLNSGQTSWDATTGSAIAANQGFGLPWSCL